MKKMIILFSLLFLVTGCSKTPELNYDGEDVVYFCTNEDIKLFESDVNVLVSKNQGFLTVDDGKWSEKINHEEDFKLEYTEKNKKELDACYFINYDNMNNKFGTSTPISFRDEVEGGIRFHVNGNYNYTVHSMEKYYNNVLNAEDYESTQEAIDRLINTEITATYILNLGSKTFAELQSETEFSEDMVERVNSIIRDRYGIELTKVNIESVEKVS